MKSLLKKKESFISPTGNDGKGFASLITLWMEEINRNNGFKGISLKVFMKLPILLLQTS